MLVLRTGLPRWLVCMSMLGKDGRDAQSLHVLEGVKVSGTYRRNSWERLSLDLVSSFLIVQILPIKQFFF